MIKFSLD